MRITPQLTLTGEVGNRGHGRKKRTKPKSIADLIKSCDAQRRRRRKRKLPDISYVSWKRLLFMSCLEDFDMVMDKSIKMLWDEAFGKTERSF